MSFAEQIKSLTAEQLSALMHADAEEHVNNGAGPNFFVTYLEKEYPQLLEFVLEAESEMPSLEGGKWRSGFLFGSSFALAALCRGIELLELPDPNIES